MLAKAIKLAFRRMGIWPLQPQIFTEVEFAPSKKTLTHKLAPLPSYPGHVPSSPSASLTDTNTDDCTYHTSSPTGKDNCGNESKSIGSMDDASDTELMSSPSPLVVSY